MTFVVGTKSLILGSNFCSVAYIIEALRDFLSHTYTTLLCARELLFLK